MPDLNILYLDNNGFFASQVKMQLEWKGYRVTLIKSEQAFLTQIRYQSYDLLIIDFLTPKSNAFSLLGCLKEQYSIFLPTIIVSAETDYRLVSKAIQLGCMDYVQKDSLVKNFVDQLSFSIYQKIDKLQASTTQVKKQQFSPEHLTKKIPNNTVNWEYFLLKDVVQWVFPQNSIKSTLSYDEFTSKIHLEDLARVKTQNNICLFSQEPVEYDFRYLSDVNRVTTYHAQIKAEMDSYGVVKRLYGYLQILSTQVLSDQNLRLKLSFLDNTADAVFIADAEKRIISINNAFTTISGYSEQESLKKRTDIINPPLFNNEFFNQVADKLKNNNFWQGEVSIRHRDGHTIPVWQSIYILKDAAGNISQSISVLRDISEQKAYEELIQFQANYDALTQLPNRTLFLDRLTNAVKLTKRNDSRLALMLLDLNKFKWINDTLGHHAGDILLQETANKLKAAVRNSDTVARLGGDEFSIIVPELEKTTDVELIARKIFKEFKQPIIIDQQEVFISGSIGITIFPDDGTDIDTLQKNADSAMYMAKNKGRNSYYYYTRALQHETEKRLKLIDDMRSAMKNQEFSLHYQPIIDVMTHKVASAETLLRWNHPQLGYIPLNDFIPVAEDSGLIREIGNWVIDKVAGNIQRWTALGLPPLQISLNQSVAEYSLSECHVEWLDILKKKQTPPGSITFEISEKVFIKEKNNYLNSIEQLKQQGIQISLDSFGTGYSSLSFLKNFPVDVIKIDRSFIHSMTDDSTNAIFVEMIIILANKLGIKVIATGVENKKQLAFLNNQCRYAQGYYFSKPLPLNEFENFVKVKNQA